MKGSSGKHKLNLTDSVSAARWLLWRPNWFSVGDVRLRRILVFSCMMSIHKPLLPDNGAVLVLGSGITGLAVALAVQSAGQTCLIVGPRDTNQLGHHQHIHLIAPGTARLLQTICPTLSGVWQEVPVLLNGLAGAEHPACRLCADAAVLRGQLLEQVRRQGIPFVDSTARSVSHEGGRWVIGLADGTDLLCAGLIDATGRKRLLASCMAGFHAPIQIEESFNPSVYRSQVALSSTVHPPALSFCHQTESDLLILTDGSQRVRMTQRGTASSAGEIDWSRVTQAIGLARPALEPEAPVRTFVDTGAQRLALEELDLSRLPPFLVVGEALVSLPPSLGAGLGAIAGQLNLLRGHLGNLSGWPELQARLTSGAAFAWTAALLRQAVHHHSGGLENSSGHHVRSASATVF